jgi:hypothetical protein
MKTKEIENLILQSIKKGNFLKSQSLFKDYFGLSNNSKSINPKFIGYAYEIKEAYQNLIIGEELFNKGKPYYYFALPYYKKCLLTLLWFETDNSKETLERYKYVKRNLVSPKFISHFDNFIITHDFVIGKKDSGCGLYTLLGERISKEYEEIKYLRNSSYFIVKNSDKYGVINNCGEEILTVKYPTITNFSENVAVIINDDYKQFVYWKKDCIVSSKREDITPFYNGLAGVKKSNKWGFIDSNNNIIIDYQFESILNFKHGLCGVKQNDKWGYINEKGIFIISPKYKRVMSFDEFQLGVVNINSTNYSINKLGKILGRNDYFNK